EWMYGGFAERAERVMRLLASPECVFVLVAAPTPPSLAETTAFLERTAALGIRTAAIVVDRWHPAAAEPPPGAEAAAEGLDAGDARHRAAGAVLHASIRRARRRRLEEGLLTRAAASWPDLPVVLVPDLPEGGVH